MPAPDLSPQIAESAVSPARAAVPTASASSAQPISAWPIAADRYVATKQAASRRPLLGGVIGVR